MFSYYVLKSYSLCIIVWTVICHLFEQTFPFLSVLEAQILKMIITNCVIGLTMVSGWICQMTFSWKHSIYVKVINRIILNKKNYIDIFHLYSITVISWSFSAVICECSSGSVITRFLAFPTNISTSAIWILWSSHVEHMHSLMPLFPKTFFSKKSGMLCPGLTYNDLVPT